MQNLTNIFLQRGRLEEAVVRLCRAIAIREQTFGSGNSAVGFTLINLAGILERQGHHPEAESTYLRALGILETSLGPRHANTGITLNNLLELYSDQGRFEETESLFRKAISIEEQAFRTLHPQIAQTLVNYARLLRATERNAEASNTSSITGIWPRELGKNGFDMPLCFQDIKRNPLKTRLDFRSAFG